MGVVVGGVDEVQARGAGEGGYLGRGAAPVGVHGVDVAVAAVPGAAAAPGALRRVAQRGAGGGGAVGEGRGDLVRESARGHRVGAEQQVPAAGVDGAGQVAGGGRVGAQEELGAGAAGPAAEAVAAEGGAARVEDADVEGVAGGAGRDRGLLVGVGDVQLAHAGGDVQGDFDEVGGACGDGAAQGPGGGGSSGARAGDGGGDVRGGRGGRQQIASGHRHVPRVTGGGESRVDSVCGAASGCAGPGRGRGAGWWPGPGCG